MTELVLTFLTLAAGGLVGWSIRGALAERAETRLRQRVSKRNLESLDGLRARVATDRTYWLEWLESAGARDVLIEHQRRDSGGCACGWEPRGRSHPEHVLTKLVGFGLVEWARRRVAESRHVAGRGRP